MIVTKFEEITRQVWNNIHYADMYQTLYGEETITDSILLELVKARNFHIRILQTPKNLESIKGTDWEWFVGSARFGWIRYAIQAKKLSVQNNTYNNINHKVGLAPTQAYQMDVLRRYSRVNGAIPLYNFYNHYPAASQADHWHCHQPFDREMLGWTFTPLHNVEAAVKIRGNRTFDKIHQYESSLPVRCLFSCPHFKKLYHDKELIGNTGDFFGEPFQKIAKLPDKFINALELGILDEFPEELFRPDIQIVPKRLAIITLE